MLFKEYDVWGKRLFMQQFQVEASSWTDNLLHGLPVIQSATDSTHSPARLLRGGQHQSSRELSRYKVTQCWVLVTRRESCSVVMKGRPNQGYFQSSWSTGCCSSKNSPRLWKGSCGMRVAHMWEWENRGCESGVFPEFGTG